jgi:hypothetical protein
MPIYATSTTLGAYCLLALHKEHMIKKNFLLAMLSKQPVSPKRGTGGEVENHARFEIA